MYHLYSDATQAYCTISNIVYCIRMLNNVAIMSCRFSFCMRTSTAVKTA